MDKRDNSFEDINLAKIKQYLNNNNNSYSSEKGGGNRTLQTFLEDVLQNYNSHSYKKFMPYISGNYMVLMQPGYWAECLHDGVSDEAKNYISVLDTTKIKEPPYWATGKPQTQKDILSFSQRITDIQLPEPNKEYQAISTRQKNSFINTRDYSGSDFSITFLEDHDLTATKYNETWHKSIELIRDGKFFNNNSLNTLYEDEDPYLITNPYSNTVWIILLDQNGMDLTGVIALFGVMPINTSLKTIVGDRSSPKMATQTYNYKFMDLQYAFYDGWSTLIKNATSTTDTKANNIENDTSLAQILVNFLKLNDNEKK